TYTAPKSLCDELRRAIEGLGPDIRRRPPNPGGSVPFAFGPGAHPREPLNPIGADTDTEVHFLGHRFVQGDAFGMSTEAVEDDVEDICRWIRDARRQSPWTVVTSHTHERGRSRSVPPDFLVAFA